MKRTVIVGAVFFSLFTSPGCVNLVTSNRHQSITGAYVEPRDAARVVIGRTTPEQTAELLGQPTRTAANDDGSETWTWSWRQERSSSGGVFLLGHGSSAETLQKSFHVLFKDGVAARKWQD